MDSETNKKRSALGEYRKIAIRYVNGDLNWFEYWEKYSEIMGVFDPLDFELEGMAENEKKEILFYVKWHGGEFGESKDIIPKNVSWKYGESMEKFGWIDRDEYHRRFSSSFKKLRDELGI